MPTKTDLHEHRESYINDKGERIASHRYRAIRDGINAEPAQDLKDDPEVIRILNDLDELERRTRPSLSLVSVAKRLNLGVPIQVMPIDWAQSDGECRDRQARNGRFFRCGSELRAVCQLGTC